MMPVLEQLQNIIWETVAASTTFFYLMGKVKL
jgi:hypothetical protein